MGGIGQRHRQQRHQQHHHHFDDAVVEAGLALVARSVRVTSLFQPMLQQFGQDIFALLAAALAELLDRGQVDRQVVAREGEDARADRCSGPSCTICPSVSRRMIVSGLSRLARKRPSRAEIDQHLALVVRDPGEDAHAARVRSSRLARSRSAILSCERGELADLDRGAQRARSQFELQLFVVVVRQRLEVADDERG